MILHLLLESQRFVDNLHREEILVRRRRCLRRRRRSTRGRRRQERRRLQRPRAPVRGHVADDEADEQGQQGRHHDRPGEGFLRVEGLVGRRGLVPRKMSG